MADETNRNDTQQQDLGELLCIRREKLKALQDEGRDPFQITKFDVTHHTQDIKDNFDALEGSEVSVGGRLMSKRGMGKVSFCDLQDKTGRIQIYARKDEMDEDNYNHFKKYDIGDMDRNKMVWWSFTYKPELEGAYCLTVRATTESGMTSFETQTVMFNAKDKMPNPEDTTVLESASLIPPKVAAASDEKSE